MTIPADVGMVIPSRGDHMDLLRAIIAASGLPAQRIAVVATPGPNDYELCDLPAAVLVDEGPRNVQRWWNWGIDWLTNLGCTRVAVLNDDVAINGETLPRLAAALEASGATLALPGYPGAPSGHCWMLDTTHGVRPDESYTWWCGDLQLVADARHAHGAVRVADAWCEHLHHNEATAADPELMAVAVADGALYDSRHHGGTFARARGWGA